MDELIIAFLDVHHPQEYQHEVYRSFQLLEAFEYPDIYSDFISLLTLESYKQTEQLIDEFHHLLIQRLDTVLHQHYIHLSTEATFVHRIEIIQGLLALQTLEDYNPVLTVLESSLTDEEQIASILEEYCNLDHSEILSIVDAFNNVTLIKLKEFIQQKATLEQEIQPFKYLLPRLRQFFKLYGKDNIGYQLIDNDVKPGYMLDTYLQITELQFERTAVNVASLILLDPRSSESPIALFNQYSHTLFNDIRLIPAIEAEILKMINVTDEHVKALGSQT